MCACSGKMESTEANRVRDKGKKSSCFSLRDGTISRENDTTNLPLNQSIKFRKLHQCKVL